jgi:hypothetical protein
VRDGGIHGCHHLPVRAAAGTSAACHIATCYLTRARSLAAPAYCCPRRIQQLSASVKKIAASTRKRTSRGAALAAVPEPASQARRRSPAAASRQSARKSPAATARKSQKRVAGASPAQGIAQGSASSAKGGAAAAAGGAAQSEVRSPISTTMMKQMMMA